MNATRHTRNSSTFQPSRRFALGLFAAAMSVAGLAHADPQVQFSQRLVVSAEGGDPTCSQGSEWSPEDFVCKPSEAAPSAKQRTMVITAAGRAEVSLVVTNDGYGSGAPVLGVKSGHCPGGVSLEDGQQERVGAKAEFVITPARGGGSRVVSATLLEPQPAQFLRKGDGREVFALPGLDQPMATAQPVDLGMVAPGDTIKLRLLAVGTMTSCEDGQLRRSEVLESLWTPTSTQAVGYLNVAKSTSGWDDKKVAPFKAVATVSY